MEKAKTLQKSWELNRECRKILQELNSNWVSLEDKIVEQRINEKRDLQIGKAMEKRNKYKEKQLIQEKNQKITDMFEAIPKTEARKIQDDLRAEDNREFREIKANLWRKWRG